MLLDSRRRVSFARQRPPVGTERRADIAYAGWKCLSLRSPAGGASVVRVRSSVRRRRRREPPRAVGAIWRVSTLCPGKREQAGRGAPPADREAYALSDSGSSIPTAPSLRSTAALRMTTSASHCCRALRNVSRGRWSPVGCCQEFSVSNPQVASGLSFGVETVEQRTFDIDRFDERARELERLPMPSANFNLASAFRT